MTKKSRPFLVVLLSCSLVAVGGSLFFGVILALFFSFSGYLSFEDSLVVPRLYFIVGFPNLISYLVGVDKIWIRTKDVIQD